MGPNVKAPNRFMQKGRYLTIYGSKIEKNREKTPIEILAKLPKVK
jgi:hypothetical protein